MFSSNEVANKAIFKLNKLNVSAFILVIFGIVTSVYGLYSLFVSSNVEAVEYVTTEFCQHDQEVGELVVDLGGAVVKPGVYQVASGNRVSDLLSLAGGLTNSADKIFVNKVLNLADKLSDGDKIYIPTIQDSIDATQVTNNEEQNKRISINTATKEELKQLNGIGDKRADDIIALRPFSSVNELLEKNILSETLFAELVDQLSI